MADLHARRTRLTMPVMAPQPGDRGAYAAMSNPLRGRDGEVASLHDHLARLRSGAGTSWLIEGGPGLGKSRLVEQAVSAARKRGFAVGQGVAGPGDAAVELAVLMDALFGGPEPLLERSALGDSHASREQRYWLLQDIQTLLEQSALRQPILICLDDLQWADGGTRAAIRSLPARLASLPVGWVLAFRPIEPGSDLGRAAAELLRNGAEPDGSRAPRPGRCRRGDRRRPRRRSRRFPAGPGRRHAGEPVLSHGAALRSPRGAPRQLRCWARHADRSPAPAPGARGHAPASGPHVACRPQRRRRRRVDGTPVHRGPARRGPRGARLAPARPRPGAHRQRTAGRGRGDAELHP